MKKKVLHITAFLLLLACAVVVVKVAPIVSGGYNMYQAAINEKPLAQRIEKIQDKKNYVKFEDVSDEYIDALLKSEDKRFYYHFGIDPIATTRAMYNNIKAGTFVQGGSTLTQQLAKNMCFSFEKRYERKVAELFVAFELEKMLSKDEILELYCNVVYFGEGCYGLKEASTHYYGVSPMRLSTDQVAVLVKTLKSPSKYNPNTYKMNTYGSIAA